MVRAMTLHNKDQRVADNIKRIREQKGWSVPLAAAHAGFNALTWANWEANKTQPRVSHLITLAEVLEVNIGEFFA